MTQDELLKAIWTKPTWHPAWRDFLSEMAFVQYGEDAVNQAWYFYKKGWNARNSRPEYNG